MSTLEEQLRDVLRSDAGHEPLDARAAGTVIARVRRRRARRRVLTGTGAAALTVAALAFGASSIGGDPVTVAPAESSSVSASSASPTRNGASQAAAVERWRSCVNIAYAVDGAVATTVTGSIADMRFVTNDGREVSDATLLSQGEWHSVMQECTSKEPALTAAVERRWGSLSAPPPPETPDTARGGK